MNFQTDSNSSVDFGRMFAFYELAKDDKTGFWQPRPSTRAVSETEKLLLERFQDYKYIIVHHRVHLYDEIMENLLVRLMANGTLLHFVKTICDLLEFTPGRRARLHAQENTVSLLRTLLTNFDDPWLEVAIRQQYALISESKDKINNLLLEAYVEDRHCFRSAFKTDEDFQSMCSTYAPEFTRIDPSLVRHAFGASKYLLQNKLASELKRVVLIGSTDKKLSFGIRNERTAEFLQLLDLHGFLVKKKLHSLTFNFWYAAGPNEDEEDEEMHKAIVGKALGFLQELVTKQLSLNIQQ